jgi:signal transduction histidine kinase
MDIISKTLAKTEGLNYARVEDLIFHGICDLTEADKAVFLLFDQSNLQFKIKKTLPAQLENKEEIPAFQVGNEIYEKIQSSPVVERWSEKYDFYREILSDETKNLIGKKGTNWLQLHLRFGGNTSATVLVHIVKAIDIGILRSYLPIAALILQRSFAFSNLKKTRLELNSVYGTSTDLICLINSKLEIIWCNKLALYYFGSAVIGMPIYKALHEGKPKQDDRMLASIFSEGMNKEFERSILTTERGLKNYSCMANVAGEDSQGSPNLAVIFFRDITSLKKQKNNLLVANEKLNRCQKAIIRQRSHNILGKVYSELYSEIEEGVGRIDDQMKELQQWLTQQKSMAGVPPELIQGFEDRILNLKESFRFTETLETSFRNFVFLRKIRKGLEEYNLNKSLEKILSLMAPLRSGEVILHKNWGDIPQIQVMAVEINVALYELICNSVEAIAQERDLKGEITLTTWCDEKWVYLKIEDNAKGLSFEDMMRIFDFYYSTKHHVTGIGVGMAVVNEYIVNRHNGNLSMDSTNEQGACFTISLPIKKH